MENIEWTIELESPVAIGHPWINSDGLIAHLTALDEYGREYLHLVTESQIRGPTDLDLDVPLAETAGVRHASISFFDCEDGYETTIYKRYREDRAHEVNSRRTKIPMNSGEYKSHVVDLAYYPASTCRFFLRGDRARLEHLFERHLTGLGKKTAMGFGAIRTWELNTLSDDVSLVNEGVAMRPIPTDRLTDWDDEQYISWLPPYWADENHTQCAPPGANVDWEGVA